MIRRGTGGDRHSLGGMFAMMTRPGSGAELIRRRGSVADAVEQVTPAVEWDEPGFPDDVAPLETDASDWQEQRLIVDDPEEDLR